MDLETLIATNPFFTHGMDKLCAVCQRTLDPLKAKNHNLFAIIPKSEPQVNVFETLSQISDFNIENGPQNVCAICFDNITAAYKFRQICNKAHEKIYNYMEYQKRQKQKFQNEGTQEAEVETSVKTETVKLEQLQASTEQQNRKRVKYRPPPHKIRAGTRVKCKVCHKLLRSDYINLHMRTHTGEKPFTCKGCNKTFSTTTSLKIHSVLHSDQKQYVCKYCGKAFKLLQALKCHERIHTGEKPHICNVCDKAFKESSCLKNHMLVHTKEKSFTCEVCAKSFGRKTTLTDHLRSHSGIKRHECHLCGKRFTQAHSMRTHLRMYCPTKKHHPEVNNQIIDISVDELLKT